MALFWTDSLVFSCSSVEATKQWWIEAFDCKQTNVPADWDNPFSSDVALKLPGNPEPTILLTDRAEVNGEGLARQPSDHPILFCSKLKKAQEFLLGKSLALGSIQDSGGAQFFEIRDPDGNGIEICEEP